MDQCTTRYDRRTFLLRTSGVSATLAIAPALSACVFGMSGDARWLNLAANIVYLGAEYHSRAAGGSGVPAELSGGVGRPGRAQGARSVPFARPEIRAMAADIAADKIDRIALLRRTAGVAAAAMPTLDLSPLPGSAFATLARAAGLPSAAQFDPYVCDDDFLLGAFMLEDGAAAAFRGLSASAAGMQSAAVLDDAAADATYHGAMIRAQIQRRSGRNPSLPDAVRRLRMALAGIADNDVARSGANASGAEVFVSFARSPEQTLRTILLGGTRSGGFLPFGPNGQV